MVNRVFLIGRLGSEPEVRQVGESSTVCYMSLATNKKSKEGKEYTSWHKIYAWNKLGDVCARYLNKGRLIYVEGEIRYSTYKDKDGIEKYSTEIHATDVKFLDRATEEGDNTTEQQSAPPDDPTEPTPF